MLKFDPHYYPYPSKRTVVYARKGMVASSQPLAAQAGLEILKKGGNAADAAIATAASLTVLEPTANGIGGDAFALIWMKDKLYGLNSSGPAPHKISLEKITSQGYKEMPKFGWLPVTVPGVPAAWAEISKKFGKLTLLECLKPAITYAQEGYPISPDLALAWNRAYEVYKKNLDHEQFKPWYDTFAPEGRAPRVGEIWSSKDLANTLQILAESNCDSFYRGALADRIISFADEYESYLSFSDLETFKAEWQEPLGVNYRGFDVWEIPPNGQGFVALQALKILETFDFQGDNELDFYHKQIEALKLSFVDGLKHITDPRKMKVDPRELLTNVYAQEKRKLIGKEAFLPPSLSPDKGGTVYLATADGEGNMVSYIQSNYMGFGSGLVVPGTGISLQNRGHTFSLDKNHINSLEGGKKTYHTIIPGFLTKDNKALGPFGVMGGFMQPQGHLQVILNTIDLHMNPQAALDAPRWQWTKGKTILIEPSFPNHLAQALKRRGHDIQISLDTGSFGRGQIIWRQSDGVLKGASEPRTDGQIACW